MTTPVAKTESPKNFAAWLTALFFIVLGAKLWVVQCFGSALPLWDQWYEATLFFQPWMDGHLTWRDFFVPSNEHRIVFTKLLDLALIKLNGRWEPLLQMTVNCFIHAAFVCALAAAIWNFFGRKSGWLICCLLAPFYALPYAAENTIWAINSQQYFMSLCALGTVAGLGFGKTFSTRWWLGLAAAFAGLFTMASGFLAAVAVGGLLVLRAIKNRRAEKGEVFTLGICVGIVALGLALKVSMPDDVPLRAHTAGQFITALGHNLAWPFLENFQFLWLLPLLPLAVLLGFYFCRSFAELRAAEFLLALALWSALQSAAIAYGRANYGDGVPASRYMDVLNIFVIAAIFAVVLLSPKISLAPQWQNLLPLLFAGVMFFQIGKISSLVVDQLLLPTRMMNLIAEERVENLLKTGDEKEFFTAPTVRPDPKVILGILQSKALQPILPGVCQSPDHRPPPYRFFLPVTLLLENAPLILGAGLFLSIALLGFSAARKELAGLLVLLALFTALGFVWSRSGNTRHSTELQLQLHLANYFELTHNPQRAAIHAAKAAALKKPATPVP